MAGVLRWRWLLKSLVPSVLLLSLPVHAQSPSPSSESERAADLAKQERFDEAIDIWLGILDQVEGDDLATVQKYLGVAFKRTGRFPAAHHFLSLYCISSRGTGDPTAATWLEEVNSELDKSYFNILISCGPAGATVRVPVAVGTHRQVEFACPVSWWFEPGSHTIEVSRSGYVSQTVDIFVDPGSEDGRRLVTLVPEGQAPPAGPLAGGDSPDTVIAAPAEPSEGHTAEWVLFGTGATLVAAAAGLQTWAYFRNEDLHSDYRSQEGLTADEAKQAYDDAYDDKVVPLQTSAYVLYGVGGAAVITAAVLWLLDDEDAGSTVARLAPVPLPHGVAASASVTF